MPIGRYGAGTPLVLEVEGSRGLNGEGWSNEDRYTAVTHCLAVRMQCTSLAAGSPTTTSLGFSSLIYDVTIIGQGWRA